MICVLGNRQREGPRESAVLRAKRRIVHSSYVLGPLYRIYNIIVAEERLGKSLNYTVFETMLLGYILLMLARSKVDRIVRRLQLLTVL